MCGERTLKWDDYIHFCKQEFDFAIERLNEPSPYGLYNSQVTKAHSRAHTYSSVRRYIQRYSAMAHSHLLLTCLSLESTDPRDMLFSLYRLTKEGHRHVLAPDCSKNVAETYKEAAKPLIESTGTVNILCINTCSTESQHLPALPSWVSDWSLRATRTNRLWNPDVYNASEDRKAMIHPSSPCQLKIEEFY